MGVFDFDTYDLKLIDKKLSNIYILNMLYLYLSNTEYIQKSYYIDLIYYIILILLLMIKFKVLILDIK